VQQRLPDGLEAASQLAGVDALEALEHHDAAPLPVLDHERPDLAEGGARHTLALAQLIDQVQGDIELADGAERLRQPADLALRLADLLCWRPSVSTGTASRRRRDATRAWWTPTSLPAIAAASCGAARACDARRGGPEVTDGSW
jgi:hypothetical protein